MTNVLGRGLPYRVQNRSDSIKMFSESDIIKMLDIFKIDIIFVMFGGRIFQQAVGIHMGSNCATLLGKFVLYSYKADFI